MGWRNGDNRSGAKSAGLRELPTGWTQDFITLSDELHEVFRSAIPSTRLRDVVSQQLQSSLAADLLRYGEHPEDVTLIVRSDAINEDLSARGKLSSHKADATVDGVLDAAEHIFRDAADSTEEICLILQRNIRAQASGHLSNELRISRDARSWLCEVVNGPFNEASESPEQERLWVDKVIAAESGPLICASREEVMTKLRRIGKYFYDRRSRRHLEWVWDGRQLWVVQNDPDMFIAGESPFPHFTQASKAEIRSLRVFKQFDQTKATAWQKLRCVSEFANAGMQTTCLYFATGERIAKHFIDSRPSKRLLEDLALMLEQPIVIRTDLRGQTAFLLPRTDAVSDVQGAQAFLGRVLSTALEQDRSLRDVCFIVHRFIPAAASAFSFAKPGERRVRVDAIWGLPDGLEFCAHDSYEVDAKSIKILDKKIRYKSTFLANHPTGEWKVSPLARRFAWEESLSSDEIGRIGASSHRLAEQRGRPVVIMWLAGIPSGSGHPDLLPWRSTEEGAPREIAASASSHFFGTSFQVRNDRDLSTLKSAPGISSISLSPDGPHLRNEVFLNKLAGISIRRHLPIDLQGSFLSHAYYVLCRAGATVACVDPINPQPVKTSFRKLVRDRIPVKIQRSGEVAKTATLLRADLLEALRTKLVEESLEVLGALEPQSLKEEMADVYEVLRAMCHVLGASMSEVQEAADEKRTALGGFQEGIILVETKDMPLVTVDEPPGLFNIPTSSRTVDVQPLVSVAGRKAKSQIDRILLPLVPPVPGMHRGSIRVEIRQLNATFKIIYGEKHVEVILDRRLRPVLRGQMDLFRNIK